MGFRAAVTTADGQCIDLHFGQSRRFMIIDVSESGAYEVREWREAPERRVDADGCHGWFDEVARMLPDVDYVLTAKIGPRPHRALSAAGITPLESPESLEEALAGLIRYRKRFRQAARAHGTTVR